MEEERRKRKREKWEEEVDIFMKGTVKTDVFVELASLFP